MIDLHTHILPHIDDGATTLEESLALIEQLETFGFTHVFATPHFKNNFYRPTSKEVIGGLKALKESLIQKNISLHLHAGHEVHYHSCFTEHGDLESFLNLNEHSTHMLLELPFFDIQLSDILTVVNKLRNVDLTPIIVHPERSPTLLTENNAVSHLIDAGCTFQINLPALIGTYGPESQRFAETLIREKKLFGIGTDVHHLDHCALIPPALSRLSELLPEKEIYAMMEHIRKTLLLN